MPQIPTDPSLDSSLPLLREGYRFIPDRCRRFQSDIFQTRLLLQNTICLSGADAAAVFYDKTLFTREEAAPRLLQQTLFGMGAVQGLDGEPHRLRKQMLMSLMTPERVHELPLLAASHWHAALDRWQRMESVVFFHEIQEILCRAVCTWAGVPLIESEVRQRTADLAMMVEGAASAGPRHLRGRHARKRSDRWVGTLIEQVRSHQLSIEEGRALHVLAWHRNMNGELLDMPAATADMLTLLRPTVAVDRFITFAALALHEHPQYRQQLRDDDALVEPFVQEVRRVYSFFPFIAARVRKDFDWKGYHFPEGTRVLLDLYGTNRDARTWQDPDTFQPERFLHWDGSAFNFIPQGGGNHYHNHRCAGEWITIGLMKMAVRMLTRAMEYDVPAQDLGISTSRMPLIPKSRFVIRNVSATRAGQEETRYAQ